MAVAATTISLATYTTLKVGGEAVMVVVRDEGELAAARESAKHFPSPPLVLGGGSNILAADAGYPGLVIKNEIIGRRYETTGDTVLLHCGAGEVWDEVVADACTREYWGLENLSAIPGSVGATPIQNVGAYGVEVADLIETATAVHLLTGERRQFAVADCQFGYRDSYFKSEAGRQWCVTTVTFRLSRTPRPQFTYKDLVPLSEQEGLTPLRIREAVIAIRANKFPDWTRVGTAGSFFKNPIISTEHASRLQAQYPELPVYPVSATAVKVSLGWILDKVCGLRGWTVGEVSLYQQQALVLVNRGGSATAVCEFAEAVAAQVKQKTEITIEWEVRAV